MKKNNIILIIIAISLSLAISSCIGFNPQVPMKGNGELTTYSIEISDFSKIEIETFVEVNYSQEKNTGSLDFTVDDNLWEFYEIYTKNNVLHIKLKDPFNKRLNINPTKGVLTVSSDLLEGIDIAGRSKFYFCTDFASEKLNISLAGSGDIFANKYPVNIEICKIEIAGSGNIYLAGAIQKNTIEIAGSGDVKALDCEMAKLDISIAGSGDVEATVTDKLDISIAGSGDVKYKGDPIVSTSVAGSGKVIKL